MYMYSVNLWGTSYYSIQKSDMWVKGEGIKENDQGMFEKHMFVGKMTTN